MTSLLVFFTAFLHAVSAAMQAPMRKHYLNVTSTFQVGAGLFGAAAVILITANLLIKGSIWFAGTISPAFWWVMGVFVVANAIATLLSLRVLQENTPLEAVTSLLVAAGLLSIGDMIFFGNSPNFWQGLGFTALIGAAVIHRQWKSEVEKRRKNLSELFRWLWKPFVAMAIYNFVTPVTNKYCAMETDALFSAWIAHAGIAILLGVSATLLRREKLFSVPRGISRGSFFIGLSIMGGLTALSNGLLSLSFEMGGSIPMALMMKRTLPPLLIILYYILSKNKRRVRAREVISLLVATVGTGLQTVS